MQPQKIELEMGNAIGLVNPLPSALAHYQDELAQTLTRVGALPRVMNARAVEGYAGLSGRLTMLANALYNARGNRKGPLPVIQTWPSLGLLEPWIWRSSGARNLVILHDPVPLRSQVGFGSFALFAARSKRLQSGPIIVSHSTDALNTARRLLPKAHHELALHPIVTTQTPMGKDADRTLLVAGQFKPTRDIDLLANMGPLLRKAGFRPKIVGRGWPHLPGWEVDSRFVSEEELDRLLGGAHVVLIPYSHYFQSGIALRALELGTVSISPRTSFALDLVGRDNVVAKDATAIDYLHAAENVVSKPNHSRVLFEHYVTAVDHSWHGLVEKGNFSG